AAEPDRPGFVTTIRDPRRHPQAVYRKVEGSGRHRRRRLRPRARGARAEARRHERIQAPPGRADHSRLVEGLRQRTADADRAALAARAGAVGAVMPQFAILNGESVGAPALGRAAEGGSAHTKRSRRLRSLAALGMMLSS